VVQVDKGIMWRSVAAHFASEKAIIEMNEGVAGVRVTMR